MDLPFFFCRNSCGNRDMSGFGCVRSATAADSGLVDSDLPYIYQRTLELLVLLLGVP